MTLKAYASTIALGAVLLGTAFTATAHAKIIIEKPWARASAGMAPTGVVFVTIKNTSDTADKVIAAKSDVAKKVGLHTTLVEKGVMKMRPVKSIVIPAHGQVELKPGGYHIMFMGLKAPFKEGQHFPLTLVFEKAGNKTVSVNILSARSMKSMGNMGTMGNMGKAMGNMGDVKKMDDANGETEHKNMTGSMKKQMGQKKMGQQMGDAPKKMNGMK